MRFGSDRSPQSQNQARSARGMSAASVPVAMTELLILAISIAGYVGIVGFAAFLDRI